MRTEQIFVELQKYVQGILTERLFHYVDYRRRKNLNATNIEAVVVFAAIPRMEYYK